MMGIVGAVLITKWSIGLLGQTGSVLLDKQGPKRLRDQIRSTLEESGGHTKVHDLHLWSIGPGIYSAAVVIAATTPKSVNAYKSELEAMQEIVHLTLEVHASGSDKKEEGNP